MRAARVAGLTAMLAMAAGGLATAQSEAPAPARSDLPYMRDPDWVHKPSADDLYSAWPKGAKVSGSARIACIVTVTGTLRACQVVAENPAGSGYGGAALSIAPQFVMKPAVSDGKVVEGQVVIPVNFDCDGSCGSIGNGLDPLRPILRGLYWTRAPSYQDVRAAYPKGALRRGIGGVASVQCRVTEKQTLGRCTVMSEEPFGRGFGAAAVELAAKFGEPINPPVSGKTAGSLARIRFTFTPDMGTEATPSVEHPKWLATASDAERQAAAGQLKGLTIIRCKVVEAGALAECQVTSDEPAAKRLGDALLPLIPKYRMATWTDEGLPTVGGSALLEFRSNMPPPFQGKAAP
jgi:hypothetical protein